MEMTTAQILILLRDDIANDWASLCEQLGLPPDRQATMKIFLLQFLLGLRKAGLIQFADDPLGQDYQESKYGPINGSIRITPHLGEIQSALGISLAELAEVRGSPMVVGPVFGKPGKPRKWAEIFVLMPFQLSFLPIYQDHITKVVADLGLTARRGDDFFTTNSIMRDIWAAICAASVLIADCTGRNPNVFYEIGIAHTVGKPVVLITQNKDDIPFDLRHLRYIEYEYTPRGMTHFEQQLTQTLRTELGL